MKKFVVQFHEVDKDDVGIVGGKGANLGEMTQAGFPVPPGFIITAHAYFTFLEEAKLTEFLHQELDTLNVNDSSVLDTASKKIRDRITKSAFPKHIARDILSAYFKLDAGLLRHARVAVRSSATAEDLPGASFAGQQETYLNVMGEANLIEKVKEAWASLFTARAIFYRATNHFDHMKVGIAVPVQKMINSEMSGIMFTIDPVTNDKSKIVIESVYGLGEMIVQGQVTPDHYEVEKPSLRISRKHVATQDVMMVEKEHGTNIVRVPENHKSHQKITDAQIVALAQIGKKLEHHYFFPQDTEWAIEKNEIYIVQTRPVTTVDHHVAQASTVKMQRILQGDPASPGMASGPVKILSSAKEISKVSSGDILVAEMTNPDYVPAMRKVVGIVTERGGRTSHAAIVSRELGIPAVVGAKDARKLLKDGMIVTVNGSTGEVYKGAIVAAHQNIQTATPPAEKIQTATHVYVNLAEPSRAAAVARTHVDGVGLLRAEFMMAEIGVHPKKIIHDRKQTEFIKTLAGRLAEFCSAFNPRPVVYRATDFKTNEYRNLTGGKAFEPEEPNPMLGFRGAARYIADPAVFELELEAIKMVRNKLGYKNLWLMIPFVRTPEELLGVKKLISAAGLGRSTAFKLWMMVEIPTNVIRLQDFLDVGIDGVSIGSNDLTMLMLGTDRDNSEVAHDFSELDPSVLWALEHVITTCAKARVTCSICGQAPSDYPQLVEKLVSWGVTSVSVNPDAVNHVRETIALAEKDRIVRGRK